MQRQEQTDQKLEPKGDIDDLIFADTEYFVSER